MWATVKHQYYIVADLPQRWAALCHRLIPGGWDWGKGKDGMCSDTHTHTHACAVAQTCTHCHWSGSSDRCKTMQCKNKTKAETESEALYVMERERERESVTLQNSDACQYGSTERQVRIFCYSIFLLSKYFLFHVWNRIFCVLSNDTTTMNECNEIIFFTCWEE